MAEARVVSRGDHVAMSADLIPAGSCTFLPQKTVNIDPVCTGKMTCSVREILFGYVEEANIEGGLFVGLRVKQIFEESWRMFIFPYAQLTEQPQGPLGGRIQDFCQECGISYEALYNSIARNANNV